MKFGNPWRDGREWRNLWANREGGLTLLVARLKQTSRAGRREDTKKKITLLGFVPVQNLDSKFLHEIHLSPSWCRPTTNIDTIDTSDADRIKSKNKLFSSALILPYLSQPKSTHVNLNNPSFAWSGWCSIKIDATEWDRYEIDGKNKLVGR